MWYIELVFSLCDYSCNFFGVLYAMQVKLQRAILANKEIPFVFLDAVQLVLSWDVSWRAGSGTVFFSSLTGMGR